MQKVAMIVVVLGLMAGCRGGGGGAPVGGGAPGGGVEVEGRVGNPDGGLMAASLPVGIVSSYSTLNDINNPTRLPDVSLSQGIVVDADVINQLNTAISGYTVKVYVEHENFLTPEYWSCDAEYYGPNGEFASQSLTTVEGNTILTSDPPPTLPTCDANAGQQDVCVTWFPDGVDCSNPTYKWNYYPAGDGLWKAEMTNISVDALSTYAGSVGLQDGGWAIRNDKYARFELYDDTGTRVQVKDYVFNVVP